jgi:hypothetical protein
MKFIADGMLGKLARWLRLAGHDVTYVGDLGVPADKQDEALLEWAKFERRMLLTCDLALHRRARHTGVRSALVGSSDVVGQLVEVSKRCGRRIQIRPENSRCPVCNGALELASKKEVEARVPSTVAKAHDKFWICKSCGKTYWKGKHWKTILEMASRYYQTVK